MARSATIAAFAVLALMPAGLLANPASFIREHSGKACFYDAGMSAAKTTLMGKVPEAATDCTSKCCITDPPAEYEAGKDYTLKVTNGVGEALVGTASGTIDGADCKSAGKTYQGKSGNADVKWTAPAAGTGDVEIGITCASGYGGTIIAFTATIKEGATTPAGPTTTLKPGETAAPTTTDPGPQCMTFTGYVNDVLCTNRATNEPDFRDPITKKNKPLADPEAHPLECLVFKPCVESSYDILDATKGADGQHKAAVRVKRGSSLHTQVTALLKAEYKKDGTAKGVKLVITGNAGAKVEAEECVNSNCKEKGSTKLPYTVYQLSVGTVALAAEDATDGTTTQNCPGGNAITAVPTTAAPTTTPKPAATDAPSDLNVKAECANNNTYANPGIEAAFGITFCSKFDAAKDTYTFLMGVEPGKQYGAVGLNSGFNMAGTNMMVLSVVGGKATLEYKEATSYSTPSNVADQPTDAECSNDATQGLVCKWTRKVDTIWTVDMSSKTLVFASKSGGFSGGFAQHDKKASIKKFNAAKAGASGAGEANPGFATKGNLAHGALMILAWIVFSPMGTAFARYGKHLGGPVWFKSHMYLQCAAVFTTIIAAIIISQVIAVDFAALLETPSKAHAQQGVAVCVLAVVQVLLGLFRNKISGPADKSIPGHHGNNRFIFNWAHRINGWVLFGLAIATVHAGITLLPGDHKHQQPGGEPQFDWVQDPAETLIFAFIGVSAGFAVIMEFAAIAMRRYDIPWVCFGDGAKAAASDPREMTLRSILVAVYIAFCVACGIALFVIIGETETFGVGSKAE